MKTRVGNTGGMVEWKTTARSVQYKTPEVVIDVWNLSGRGWQFTVFNEVTNVFDAAGERPTMDEACEAALAAAQERPSSV